MHGVKREKVTEAVAAAKRKAQQEQISKYQALVAETRAKRVAGAYDQEALLLTNKLLNMNPEYYTFWNFRREILSSQLKDIPREKHDAFIAKELKFNVECIKKAHKSYWVWHHRVWIIQKMVSPPWHAELDLCAALLNIDKRNFHCWDYRRFVRAHVPESAKEELSYTYKKVCQNFSNYSAFHLRSTLMPGVHDTESCEDRAKSLHGEFELVRNAIFTEPNDQSPWFYHRWLLGRSAMPVRCLGAYLVEDAVVLIFTRPVSGINDAIKVVGSSDPLTWAPSHGRGVSPSCVWFASTEGLSTTGMSLDIDKRLGLQESTTVAVVAQEAALADTWEEPRPAEPSPADDASGESDQSEQTPQMQVSPAMPDWYSTLISEELQAINELVELEPNSKWPLLTQLHLLRLLEQPIDYLLPILDTLEEVDPLRKGYYRDIRSKYRCESATQKYIRDDCVKVPRDGVSLAGSHLTTVASLERLALCVYVDLSHNKLKRVDNAHLLFAVQSVNVSHNEVTSLEEFSLMRNLTVLDASHNKIASMRAVKWLVNVPNLTFLHLRGNPISESPTYREDIHALLPSLVELDGVAFE